MDVTDVFHIALIMGLLLVYSTMLLYDTIVFDLKIERFILYTSSKRDCFGFMIFKIIIRKKAAD